MAKRAAVKKDGRKIRRVKAPEGASKLVIRLIEAMDKKNLNPLEVAQQAGLGNTFVYDLIHNRSRNPTTTNLSAIAEILGVSLNYLILGTEGGHNDNSNTHMNQDMVSIDPLLIPSDLECTKWSAEKDNAQPLFFQEAWLERITQIDPENVRVTYAKDDGMAPSFSYNDMLLVDISRTEPSPPGIFAIYDGSALVIRRLEASPGAKNIWLRCENKDYTNFEVDGKDIVILGRVIWHSRKLS